MSGAGYCQAHCLVWFSLVIKQINDHKISPSFCPLQWDFAAPFKERNYFPFLWIWGSLVPCFGQWSMAEAPQSPFQTWATRLFACFCSRLWKSATRRSSMGFLEIWIPIALLQRFWFIGSRDLYFYQAPEVILIQEVFRQHLRKHCKPGLWSGLNSKHIIRIRKYIWTRVHSEQPKLSGKVALVYAPGACREYPTLWQYWCDN